ncbi:hypothetical protein J6590_052756 [Homalodisca vitripennis]|nr:hypothetical protein J6590_052756 [Homalodisca vitripennis]
MRYILSFSEKDDTEEMFKQLKFTRVEPSRTNQNDFVLLMLATLGMWVVLSTANLLIILSYSPRILMFAVIRSTHMLCILGTLKMAVMKHLLIKRLNNVKIEAQNGESTAILIFHIRRLLRCNTSFDSACAPMVTAVQLTNFVHILNFIYNLWRIYGAQLTSETPFEDHLIVVTFNNASYYSVNLLVAVFCSMVVDKNLLKNDLFKEVVRMKNESF